MVKVIDLIKLIGNKNKISGYYNKRMGLIIRIGKDEILCYRKI